MRVRAIRGRALFVSASLASGRCFAARYSSFLLFSLSRLGLSFALWLRVTVPEEHASCLKTQEKGTSNEPERRGWGSFSAFSFPFDEQKMSKLARDQLVVRRLKLGKDCAPFVASLFGSGCFPGCLKRVNHFSLSPICRLCHPEKAIFSVSF